MSKRIISVLVISFVITAPLWVHIGAGLFNTADEAMQAGAQPVAQGGAPCGGIGVACSTPQAVASPVSVSVTHTGGGFINIGQIFGTLLQPWVDSIVQSVVIAGVGYLALLLKNKIGVTLDADQRKALETWLDNQANSLIADGMVSMNGTKLAVDPHALEGSANTGANLIPDALTHFGLDGPRGIEPLKGKIVDRIPQTKAGALIVAGAHAATT